MSTLGAMPSSSTPSTSASNELSSFPRSTVTPLPVMPTAISSSGTGLAHSPGGLVCARPGAASHADDQCDGEHAYEHRVTSRFKIGHASAFLPLEPRRPYAVAY
jgi:hypothetical protein